MRILIIGDVPPFVVGGAEMQTWRLARQWKASGHQVHIAGHRIPTGTCDDIELFNLPVIRRTGRLVRGISFFVALAFFLVRRRSAYDLIYCRFLGEAALSVAFLKQLSLVNLPLVAVPASAGDEGNADAALLRSLPATKILVSLLNRHCDGINYITPGVERSMEQIGIRPKIKAFIPNGVAISQYSAQGPQEKIYRLVFVGRLVYEKGIDLLFLCLRKLIDKGFYFHLTLVGDGEMREALEKLALDLGISRYVCFLGRQSQDVVIRELKKAHFFILPSRYEGLSNAALEALSCGLPCLLSRCGGLDAFLTKNAGWVFNPCDTVEMEAALVEALQVTPERWHAMSQVCRELVHTKFSLDVVASENISLFQEIINKTNLKK